MMRQEGKEKEESKDPLRIPRAASRKEQKLVKLSERQESHEESMQGLGLALPLACPPLTHIHTGDKTALPWPPGMPHWDKGACGAGS